MNRIIVSCITLMLMSVGLMVFSLAPNFPTNAQNKKVTLKSFMQI